MAVDFPDHPFWDFSLKVYLTEGVPPACVEIQDKYDIDVNIVLFCLWLGESGRGGLSQTEIAVATGAVAAWNRDIVCGLRAIRRKLKGGLPPAPQNLSDPLRQQIQNIEIDIEHVEQLTLAASVERQPDPALSEDRRAADAVVNIDAYLKTMNLRFDEADCGYLAVPLGVAFPGVTAARIAELCRTLRSG